MFKLVYYITLHVEFPYRKSTHPNAHKPPPLIAPMLEADDSMPSSGLGWPPFQAVFSRSGNRSSPLAPSTSLTTINTVENNTLLCDHVLDKR